GLVLAEVFTGKNPLQPLAGEDFTAPVELAPLDPIPGELGEPLRYRLQEMLARKPEDRPTAADLLNVWQELFLDAARRANALTGQSFSSRLPFRQAPGLLLRLSRPLPRFSPPQAGLPRTRRGHARPGSRRRPTPACAVRPPAGRRPPPRPAAPRSTCPA